jgi:hypothetical protein
MGAREKLNSAYVYGSMVLVTFIGLVYEMADSLQGRGEVSR